MTNDGHAMANDDFAIIANWSGYLGLMFTEKQIRLMCDYLDMVRETAPKMNLVAKGDLPVLVERHLLDSLTPLRTGRFFDGAQVADIGSGAGFPGIPLAIARPKVNMALYESRRLKALFLKKVVEKLGLINVAVRHQRWEDDDSKYDILLARAVYGRADLIKVAQGRLNEGGVILHFAKLGKIDIIEV